MKNLIFIIYFCLMATLPFQATGKADLTGIVLNAETFSPIEKADIFLPELKIRAKSNKTGEFILENLVFGTHHIEVGKIGFLTVHFDFAFDSTNNNISLVFRLYPYSYTTPSVIVTGNSYSSKYDEIFGNISILEGKELQRNAGLTLASTLKNEAGFSMRSMGPAPARPVIRGLGGSRIMIAQDGTDINDLSATSPDHAVSIEPHNLERIEIIRGPKSLLFTSTAFGGVVNVITNDLAYQKYEKFTGNLTITGESVNNSWLGGGNLYIPFNKIVLHGAGSYRKAGDLKIPNGILKNTGIATSDYSIDAAYAGDSLFCGVNFSEFSSEYGVPGGFVGAHPKGVNIEMFKRTINLKNITHLHSVLIDNLEINLGRVYYSHKEFESNKSLGAEFVITDYSGRLFLNQNKISNIENGTLGFSFNLRNFEMGGYVFTPPTSSTNLALFTYQNIVIDNMFLQVSARYDHTNFNPKPKSNESKIGLITDRNFNTFSGSISANTELSKKFFIGLNISKSSRAPTIEELFSEGPHLAAYSYDIGNPNLEAEKGYGFELSFKYGFSSISFSSNSYVYLFDNYIIPRNTGKINYAQLLPIYQSFGVPAKIYGSELEINLQPFNNIIIKLNLSYTYGEQSDNKIPLPMIPPLKTKIEAEWKSDLFSVGFNLESALSQERIDTYEERTPAYIIFGAYAQYTFFAWNFVNAISLNGENLGNTIYRNHLSRTKSVFPEEGINIKLLYKVFF